MSTTTISEARAHLPELLNKVADGDEVTITRHGRPVAVVVRPDVLRSRRKSAVWDQADRLGEMLAEARGRDIDFDTGGISSVERAEELVADIRAGRDSRP